MKNLTFLGFAFLLCFVPNSMRAQSGTLDGFIVSPPVNLVGSLSTTVTAVQPQSIGPNGAVLPGPPPVRVTSDETGAFHFTGLVPGNYALCAQQIGDSLGDPCSWADTPPTITIDSGVAVKMNLEMVPLVTQPVQLNDPNNLLPQDNLQKPRGRLILGVSTPHGLFVPSVVTQKSSTGQLHRVLLPVGRLTRLGISTDLLQLSAPDGTAYPALGASIPIRAAANRKLRAGEVLPVLVIQITGIRAQ